MLLLPLRQRVSSSRSGTATTSRACRSRWRRTSASRAAARSTTRRARSATSSRTTCSRCWRTWRWSRPSRTDSESIRDEKVKVLKAIPTIDAEGHRARPVPRLPSEPGVAPDSQTETFAALRLEINSWRWQGVPFYIRAGKCLPVTVHRGARPAAAAAAVYSSAEPARPTTCGFRISPDITIAIGVNVLSPEDESVGQTDGTDREPASGRRRDGRLRTRAGRRDARRRDAVRARGLRRGSVAHRRSGAACRTRRSTNTSRAPGDPTEVQTRVARAAGTIRSWTTEGAVTRTPRLRARLPMKIDVLARCRRRRAARRGVHRRRRADAVAARGMFALAVSGGHTPWMMLRALAALPMPGRARTSSRSTSASRPRAIRTATSRTSPRACCRASPLPPGQLARDAGRGAGPARRPRATRAELRARRRHAAGARSRASRPRARRPHGVAGSRRSGARGHRRRRRADRRLIRASRE